MAKQLVNPIERHVEKAVVGIAGGLLIAAIALYLVTSPNQLQLGGQTVTPGTIDQTVSQKAADVRNRIRSSQSEVKIPDKLFPEFEKSLDPYSREKLVSRLPAAVSIGPEVTLIDLELAGPAGGAKLVEVTPLGEVRFTQGRSMFLFKNADGTERHTPVNWVTLSSSFDVKGQMAVQSRGYGATRKEVYFGPPSVQRRERRSDGGWSDQDWKDVSCWPTKEFTAVPKIEIQKDDQGRAFVPSDRRQEIDRFQELLIDPIAQLEIVRPLMWPIVNGDPWTFPELGNRRDLLMQDDYFLFRNEPPSADPTDRYRVEAETRPAAPAAEEKPQQRIAKQFEEIKKLMKSANDNLSENEATLAYNLAFDIQQDKEAAAGDKDRAKRLAADAEQLGKEIRRRNRLGGPPRVAGPGGKPDAEKEKPKREPPAIQQVWAHDAAVDSVKSGSIYQYRVRPRVYNRMAGAPERFKDPTDAAKLFIEGEWSAPVEVTVPRATEFYFTSEDERNRKVSAELFQWFDGVWTKARWQYGIGERLARSIVTEVKSDNPNEVDRAEVAFEADGVIVDIDFQRNFRERKKGAGKGGVKFGPATTACCVVYADSNGRLYERFVPNEKSHPDKLAAAGKSDAWKPKGKGP